MAKTNIMIDYDFSLDFGATTISNTLTAGTSGLDNSTGEVTVTNKKYENVTTTICTINTDANNITFKNCLFDNCDLIIDTGSTLTATTGVTVTFTNCTFNDCDYVFDDQDVANIDLDMDYCIINNCVFINSVNTFTLDNSVYTKFVGYTDGTYTFTETYNLPPLFIPDSFILMSVARGYKLNSPAIMGEHSGWTADAGCYTEVRAAEPYASFVGNTYSYAAKVFTRSAGSTDHNLKGYNYILVAGNYYRIASYDATTITIADTYSGATSNITITASISASSITFEGVPDSYSKELILTGYESQNNINGDLIQQHQYGDEKKGVKLQFSGNWLSETTQSAIITMYKCEDDTVRLYPESTDLTKWIEGTLYKEKTRQISRQKSIFYDGKSEITTEAGYVGNSINILINRTEGSISE